MNSSTKVIIFCFLGLTVIVNWFVLRHMEGELKMNVKLLDHLKANTTVRHVNVKANISRHVDSSNVNQKVKGDSKQLKIFYFGITHHTNRVKALLSNKTWAKTVPEVVWYSDIPDLQLNVTVISYDGKDDYKSIPFRALMVCHHVLEHHRGYDWYVRLWDDNFIFDDRLRHLLRDQNSSHPVLIGEMFHHRWPDAKDHSRWLDYHFVVGSAWVLSRAAIEQWIMLKDQNKVNRNFCTIEGIKETRVRLGNYEYSEDIILSQCLLTQGVAFVQAFGFHYDAISHDKMQMTLEDAVNGVIPLMDRPDHISKVHEKWCGFVKCINYPNTLGVIVMHYVTPADMVRLYLMLKRKKGSPISNSNITNTKQNIGQT